MWMKGQTVQRNTRFPKYPCSCRRSLTYIPSILDMPNKFFWLWYTCIVRISQPDLRTLILEVTHKPSRFCLTPRISPVHRGSGSNREEPKPSAPAPRHSSSTHHNNVLFAKWLIPFWFTAVVKRNTLGGGPRYLSCQGRPRGHAFYWSTLIKALNSDQRRFQPSIMVNSD